MNTLRVVTRTRCAQLLAACRSLGLSVALILILAGVFRNGHPFERHHVVFDGNSITADQQLQLRALFKHAEEIRFQPASDRTHTISLLQTGMASVVLSRDPGGKQLRLLVAPTEVLFAWGLAAELPRPVELAIVPARPFGYLNFLLPGVLTFSLLTFCLRRAAQVREWVRQRLRSPAPAAGPRFLARACSQALLGLMPVALLVLTAHWLFGLALSFQSVAEVVALSLAGLSAFMGLGLLLSSWIESEPRLAAGFQSALLPLVLLSEVAFTLDDLPRALRTLGELLPTTYLVRLLREALLDGRVEASRLALAVALLLSIGVVGFALGVWRLRRQKAT